MIKFRQLFSFTKKEIDECFSKAKRKITKPEFRLLFLPKTEAPGKLLIVIPKASGKAYKRNKIRRQIKSIFYEENLYQNPGIWIIIVYKKAMDLSFKDIKQFLQVIH